MLKDLVEALPLPPGKLGALLHAARPDAARRDVQNAQQAQLVGGVGDHAEIGQHVLDLRAVEKLRAAVDAVRDAAALEGKFHLVGERVDAVEHGVVAPGNALREGVQDLVGDKLRLLVLVGRDMQAQKVAVVLRRPERLALALAVVFDDRVGRVQDVAGGAVVLL